MNLKVKDFVVQSTAIIEVKFVETDAFIEQKKNSEIPEPVLEVIGKTYKFRVVAVSNDVSVLAMMVKHGVFGKQNIYAANIGVQIKNVSYEDEINLIAPVFEPNEEQVETVPNTPESTGPISDDEC